MVGQIKSQQQLFNANESVKKCRGNRRLQRLRKKYRAKGINKHELKILINMLQTIESYHQNNLSSVNSNDHQVEVNNKYGEEKNDLNVIDIKHSKDNISIFVDNPVRLLDFYI